MRVDPSKLEDLKEKVVFINRVTKVVKGGRNFRFSALVVVGDENGHVGVGMGKSIEIPEAIKKGIEDAKKNMVSVAIVGTTVPHEIYGKFGTGKVLIMPAKEGTGVIAGGPARAVLELAGLKDVRAKSLGSNNPRNMVNATINGLASLRTAEDIAKAKEIIATVSAEKAAHLPEQMIQNIAKGRLAKFLKEVCLLNQEDIMDAKKTVREVLAAADPELKVLDFKRFTLKAE